MSHDQVKPTVGGKPINLKDDEKIIWQGRPVQGLIFNKSLVIGGAVLILAGLGLILGAGATGGLLGLPLLVGGGYLAVGHALLEQNRSAGTYYALTNQRGLVAYGAKVMGYPILAESRLKLIKGRTDTIHFAIVRQLGVQNGSSRRKVSFSRLENGDQVFAMMQQIQKEA